MNKIEIKKLYSYKKYLQFSRKSEANLLSYIIKFVILRMGLCYSNPKTTECDILFLHGASGKSSYRLNSLSTMLQKKGFNVQHDAIYSHKRVLLKRRLKRPSYQIPLDLLYEASHAEYIVEKYQPKILLTFMNSGVISSLLRQKMKELGKVINISHSVTTKFYGCSMFDFDYYFVFGQSSLDNISQNPVRFGNTKAIITGSIFVDENFSLQPNKEMKNILFFSSWIPREVKDVVLRNFSIVAEYARQHKEYNFFIKLHPLENPSIWEKEAKGINNIHILAQRIGMKDALQNVSLVLHQWSNASLEAALLNRPSISVDVRNAPDNYLFYDRFFTPKATNVSELHERVKKIFKNYDYYLSQCGAYASYHLERRYAVDYICDCIESIYHGREDFPVHIINETGLDNLSY